MSNDSHSYIFFGKVFPERVNVYFSPPIVLNIKNEEAEIEGVLTIYVDLSQIAIRFESKQIVKNCYTLKNIIEDAIRMLLDTLGYTLGCGYDVEITSMIDSLGNPQIVFGVSIKPNIEEFKSKRPKTFQEIFPLFFDERGNYLRLCLSDLREAIRKPKDTGFFCFRAIESLTHYFANKNSLDKKKDSKKIWEIFKDEVGIIEEDIRSIMDYSDPVRHGGTINISPEERQKILDLTWEIVDKYVKFAKNGYKKI
jgi:hypothetical protein